MKYLYRIYQICIALPVLLVLTVLTALVTIAGSLFNAPVWGYGRKSSAMSCSSL